MKKLSVIIPFLNEKEEIFNTVKSLLDHLPSNTDIDILIINDASDDGYPYNQIISNLQARYKNIKYFTNKIRLGVAESRNFGVSQITTPYFLLLDAHMRFYDTSWYNSIVEYLDKNEKVLLCCQSSSITRICNELVDLNNPKTARGAYIFFNPKEINFLDVQWNYSPEMNNISLCDIACVLGAGYACHKSYWDFLRGLEGLCEYGLDEQFISLKVWLTGGKCILLNNFVLGHIYRTNAPYNIASTTLMYNKMFITEVLLPHEIKYEYYKTLQKTNNELFLENLSKIRKNNATIKELRSYFSSIIKPEKLKEYQMQNKEIEIKNINVYERMKSNDFDDEIISLFIQLKFNDTRTDLMKYLSWIIVLLMWAKRKKDFFFEKLASAYLNKIINEVSFEIPMNFGNGLLGFGYLIEYIIQHHLIDGDTDEILYELDKRIECIDLMLLEDNSLDTGVLGYIMYAYARIKGKWLRQDNDYFINYEYTNKLLTLVSKIISTPNTYNIKDITPLLELHDWHNEKTTSPTPISIDFLRNSTRYQTENGFLLNIISKLD